jgi:hypothetical protein
VNAIGFDEELTVTYPDVAGLRLVLHVMVLLDGDIATVAGSVKIIQLFAGMFFLGEIENV